MTKVPQNSPIVLFDGLCHLCSTTVQWLLERDTKEVFRFASLQSELGQHLVRHRLGPSTDIDSVVLIDGGSAYVCSDAVIEIARRLGFPWSILIFFKWVPLSWRDAIYRWVARNRYRWFGARTTCWMPNKKWETRFLDAVPAASEVRKTG